MSLRQRFGRLLAGIPSDAVVVPERELYRAFEGIPFHSPPFVGMGAGSNEPADEALLREAKGIADLATRAICNRVAGLNLEVVAERSVRAGTTEEEILDDHPLALLLKRPNPNHSGRQWRRLVAQMMVTIGESFHVKVTDRSRFRIPQELHLIPAGRVRPIGDGVNITSYEVISSEGKQLPRIPKEEILRIWDPDPESFFEARGVLGPQAIIADLLKFQQEHLRSHYENNAVPPTVFEATADDAQAPNDATKTIFERDWFRKYHQRQGKHRGLPGWVPPGWMLKQIDAHGGAEKLLEVMAFARDWLLMAYGVSKTVVGFVEDANRANMEAARFGFDQFTIEPLTDCISDALTWQVAQDYPQEAGVRLLVRFEPFVAPDKDFELRQEEQDLRLKVRSINEIRLDRGDDPVPWGDLPVGSMADTPYTGEDIFDVLEPPEPDAPTDEEMGGDAEEVGGEAEPEEEEARFARSSDQVARMFWDRAVERERRFIPAFTAGLQRAFAKQREIVLTRLARVTGEPISTDERSYKRVELGQLFDPEEWAELFTTILGPVRRRAFRQAGDDAKKGAETIASLPSGSAQPFIFSERVQRILRTQDQVFSAYVNDTSWKRLGKTIADSQAAGESVNELATRIVKAFRVRRKQAITIARTEVLKATQPAQVEGFRQSGVVRKHRWNTSLDAFVRDSHEGMDAHPAVDLHGGLFTLGSGNTAAHPGDMRLPAADVVNCRCFLTPVVEIGGEEI